MLWPAVCAAQTAGWYAERVFSFLERSDADQRYMERPSTRFVLTPQLGTTLNQYTISTGGHEYTLSSEPIVRLGASAGYRGLTVGYMQHIGSADARSRNRDFFLDMAGNRAGATMYVSRMSNYSFSHDDDEDHGIRTDAFRSRRFHLSAYYAFNHRRFSYPAAIVQTFIQKQNAGSIIAGLSVNTSKLDVDTAAISDSIRSQFVLDEYFTQVRASNACLRFGYGYNWVLRHHWMLHASGTMSLAFSKSTQFRYADRTEKDDRNSLTYEFHATLAAVYDRRRYFAAFNMTLDVNQQSDLPIEVVDLVMRMNLRCGLRF